MGIKAKKWAVYVLYNIVVVLAILALIEWGLNVLLNHPSFIPGRLRPIFKTYYLYHDRNIIQLMPACARYDDTLFYTLKPGSFTFSNREFSTAYRVNHLGLRDDEASLQEPDIIVLGDSYAMGWGVQQDQSFGELLARKTGLKVLNAGVSSYGTAREIASLERFQTDSLRYLIIQYCPNDWQENDSFRKDGNRLIISSRQVYEQACRRQAEASRYYPFKHLMGMARISGNILRHKYFNRRPAFVGPAPDHAAAFLNVIAHAKHLPPRTKIILFCMDDHVSPPEFVRDVQRQLNTGPYAYLKDRFILLDLSRLLHADDFFILDDHLNAQGHEKIAERLEEVLKQYEYQPAK